MINIVTNVTPLDGIRIKYTIPNWIRVFDNKIKSLKIIIDEKPIEGRIKTIPNSRNNYFLNDILDFFLNKYPFIVTEKLNYNEVENISKQFFKKGNPVRCQQGTPVFAFLKGISSIEEGIILRTDCDIIYYDNGWVDKSIQLLNENKYDIIEPSMLGGVDYGFSSRSFLINKKDFMKRMPIKAYKLDLLRIIDRKLKKRSVYLALEQMIQKEIKRNSLSRKKIDYSFGHYIHFISSAHFEDDKINEVISRIENNSIPDIQQKEPNFVWEYWK